MNRTGRAQHEVALLIVGLVVGVAGLVLPLLTPTLKALGSIGAVLFFALTFVSSCLALSGIFLRWKGVKGFYIEQAGLLLQALAWIVYALAALAVSGVFQAFIFAAVAIGLSLGHIARALRIPAEARQIATAAVVAGVIRPEEER